MALNFNGITDFVQIKNGPVVSGFPFTFATWAKTNSAAPLALIDQIDAGNFNRNQVLYLSGRRTTFLVRDLGSPYDPVQGTAQPPDGTWAHRCGIARSSVSRSVYTDGGDKQTETAPLAFANVNSCALGASNRTHRIWYMDGDMADTAIWNVDLSDEEVASLAKGYSPLFIRPQNLVFYRSFVRGTDSPGIGTIDSVTGTVVSDHPPMIYPSRVHLGVDAPTRSTQNADLFIEGHSTETLGCSLYVFGFDTESDDIVLHIGGKDTDTSSIELFIAGLDTASVASR